MVRSRVSSVVLSSNSQDAGDIGVAGRDRNAQGKHPHAMLIGIDPGPQIQSFVIFDGKQVLDRGDVSVADMVGIFTDSPDLMVAIEYIDCMGMAVGSETFATVFNIGRLYSAVSERCRLIPRRDIKLHLCGSCRAKDPNVRQALIDKVGPVGRAKAPGPTYGIANHLWAALAVAATAVDLQKTGNEVFFE